MSGALAIGVLVATSAFVVGRFTAPETERVYEYDCECGGESWSLYVEGTDDMSVYRGVYKRDGNTRYSVTGRGVTEALRNLADKIDSV